MKFLVPILFISALALSPAQGPTQVCFGINGNRITQITCPIPIPGPIGLTGPMGPQGIPGLVGPQGPTGSINAPTVPAASVPQNTLGIMWNDGTVTPIMIINPQPLVLTPAVAGIRNPIAVSWYYGYHPDPATGYAIWDYPQVVP